MRPMQASLVGLALCALASSAAADDDPRDAFATTIDLHVGGMLVESPDAALDGGPLAGLAVRWIGTNLVSDVLGLAFVGDAELGYADELVGQLRAGVGLGVVQGKFSASVFGGGAVGSMARAASSDAFVGANVAISSWDVIAVWFEGARAIGRGGPDHDRLELRVVLPTDGVFDTAWVLGARYLAFGGLDRGEGAAYLVTIGYGGMGSPPNSTF